MPQLELRDLISIGTMLVTVSGVVFALRAAVTKLESGQTEVLRQLGALHKRMDHYGERIQAGEVQHARLEERVANLRGYPGPRDSQRFRLTETD